MSGNQQAFQNAMNQGHSSAWDQAWEEASKYYGQALQEFPENPLALTSMGMALFELKKYDKALICFQRAAKVAPNDPLPPEKMARIYERLGQVSEAVNCSLRAADLHLQARDADKSIENYIRATALQPDNLQARSRLAAIYERMKRTDKAVTEYLATAAIMQRTGNLEKAAQTVEHCLQLIPNNEEALQARNLLQKKQLLPNPVRAKGSTASLIMAEVRQLETEQTTQEINKRKPQDPIQDAQQKALVQMASLLFEQPDEMPVADDSSTAKGTGLFKRGSKKPVDPAGISHHLSQAIELLTHGNDDQAVTELEGTINAGLSHPAISYVLGMILCKRDEKKALRYLQQSLRNADYSLASCILMGQLYRKSENYKEAAVAYLRALNIADTRTVATEQIKDLNRIYESIIEEQPQQNDKEALLKMCDAISALLARLDWLEYLKMARQQLAAQPPGMPPLPLAEMLLETSSSKVVETIGNIRKLVDLGKTDSAMEEAFYALQVAPTYLPLHIQIGELLVKNGLIQDAIIKFNLVAKLYHLRGETAQAISLLSNVVALSPMDFSVRTSLIELYVAQGLYDDAIQQSMELAQNYESEADFDKARKTYTDTLSLAAESSDNRSWSIKILTKIADIDVQRVDWSQAVRVFEQIRTLKPEDANIRAQLVDLNFRLRQDEAALNEVEGFIALLENSGKFSAAVEFLEKLIMEWSDRLELRKTLAELYARHNQIDHAVEQLDAVANVLMDTGNVDGTVEIVERIIALNPPKMAEYQAALAKLKGSA